MMTLTKEQLRERVQELEKESIALDRLKKEMTAVKHQLEERNLLILNLASCFPNSYISIIEKDLTVGKTFGNEFERLGIDPSTFIGLSVTDIFGENAPFVTQQYQKTFEGEQVEFELFMNKQQQLYKTFPIRYENGDIRKILVVVENLMPKKEAQLAKQKNVIMEKELTDLLRFSPISISISNKIGTIQKCNPALEKLTGYSAAELTTPGFLKRITPDQWHELEDRTLKSLSATNRTLRFEKELVHQSGKVIPIEVSTTATFSDNSDIQNIFQFYVDLSKQKKQKAKLVSQNINLKRFSFIHKKTEEIAKVGGWEVNLKANTNYWTDEVYTIHETNRDEHKPTVESGVEFYTKESVPILTQALQNAMEKGERFDEQLQIITKKGNRKDVWVLGYVENDAQGNPESIFGIIQDITEQKKIESELTTAKERAEESNRLKSAFLANISHEIRTPLNAILGFSKLLSQSNLSDEQRKLYCDQVMQGNSRLLAIIDGVLELSKLEANRVKVTKKLCNLNQVLDNLVSSFTDYEFKGNNTISINYGLQTEAANFYLDEDKIVQILRNLIENGLKFTSNGKVEVGYSVNKDELHCYVKDNGRGIAPEHKEAIFNRFIQIDIDYSKSVAGTGLGLSIVKQLVSLLEGKIWVESTLGAGATFHLTIPYVSSNPN